MEEQGSDAPSSVGSDSPSVGGYSDDTVGNTSGSYSVDDQGNVTDSFSLGISPSLSQEAMNSIGRGLTQKEQGFFGQGYNVQDFGRQSVSNVSNARNYDPNFAMMDKISRGLAGQVPGLKDFDKTTFGMNISMNPLAQIDPSSPLGQKYSQALALAPTMMGPFSKTGLQGLTLSQIDKMDPMGLASLMAAANMSRNNPYGTTSAPGYVGTVAEMLGLVQSPQDISYNMSLKDAVQTARSGLAYGTVPGQNVSNFGQISGITDQFSKDMSNISMDKIGRDFSTAGKGIANLAANAFNEVTTAVQDAVDFLNNSKAGSTIEEEIAKEEARIEIADLEEQRQNQLTDPSFAPMSTTTIGIEDLDPAFMDVDRTKSKDAGAYSAVPQPVMVDQLQRDIAKSRGIFDLPQAADLQNNQIAAGSSTGQPLSTGPMSGGYTLSPISSTGSVREKTVQGPPEPPEKAPPGYVDIVMAEDKTPTFAGTNMSIFGGKGVNQSYKPTSELEAQAAIDAGFSLEPFSPMFGKTYDPADYTRSGVPLGVNLTPMDYVSVREPEVTTRFKTSDLPREVQEIVDLRSNLDYGKSIPLQTILDRRTGERQGIYTLPTSYPYFDRANLPLIY